MSENLKATWQGAILMQVLYGILSWESPLGSALFFFFSASGAGIFFWGLSHFNRSTKE